MEIKLPIPKEVNEDIRKLFKDLALEVIQEVKDQEAQLKPYMTKQEACEVIGIAPSTLQRWIHQEGLREITVQGKKLISRETLLEFMRNHEE